MPLAISADGYCRHYSLLQMPLDIASTTRAEFSPIRHIAAACAIFSAAAADIRRRRRYFSPMPMASLHGCHFADRFCAAAAAMTVCFATPVRRHSPCHCRHFAATRHFFRFYRPITPCRHAAPRFRQAAATPGQPGCQSRRHCHFAAATPGQRRQLSFRQLFSLPAPSFLHHDTPAATPLYFA